MTLALAYPGRPYTIYMKKLCAALLLTVVTGAGVAGVWAHGHRSRLPASYLGFDRNDYPGDGNLPALRKSFAFTGFWLNNPPGEQRQ